MNIESIWLPSALCMPNVAWSVRDGERLHAELVAHGETAKIDCGIDPEGGLRWVTMPRWGNPGGSALRYVPCGGVVESERRFGAYTIPERMRVGWYFGSRRFETEGEFFRVTIDEAVFR